MGSKVKGEKWNKFGKSGANSQKTREQKNTSTTSGKAISSHHTWNLSNTPHKNLKGGI